MSAFLIDRDSQLIVADFIIIQNNPTQHHNQKKLARLKLNLFGSRSVKMKQTPDRSKFICTS
ncbi:MAG: hypothetical protein EAZ19_11840 [Oscillatoriales cyanobacterium]|nr:MAG: hypothetical protein EAZ94_11055 [Oscillatoriales cyanobacterium]TAG14854.1 MAG: hypothetical protein EAZ39_23185 [Oscillatoriales cyanobacterium]TAG50120.1 MAG: hypothetical protein EAZ33_00210 [Oscillatoriales cyanobacterium]TAG53454.1 MAG: hypothetical protein EAZ28_27400 [Oscillatoriales cyanobacterium]TAG67782.1 MAG: hypothetical protein EAZ25_05935 [Oscillatoriales cyanobacterium]